MRLLFWIAALSTALAACSGGSDGLTIVVSSPGTIGVGEQRVLLAVLDEQTNEPRVAPGVATTAVFVLDGDELGRSPAEWIWAIENVRGFYAVRFDFPEPGTYQVHLESETSTTPARLLVLADVAVVEVGEPALLSESPTYPAYPLEAISTDPHPEPSFYSLSIADAVASGRPTVIVFATPAFCSSAVCGPTLDMLKAAAPAHPGANFVHVEVFEDLETPDALTIAPSVVEWGLPSEPWVFVTSADGLVAARFEGALGLGGLETALAEVGA